MKYIIICILLLIAINAKATPTNNTCLTTDCICVSNCKKVTETYTESFTETTTTLYTETHTEVVQKPVTFNYTAVVSGSGHKSSKKKPWPGYCYFNVKPGTVVKEKDSKLVGELENGRLIYIATTKETCRKYNKKKKRGESGRGNSGGATTAVASYWEYMFYTISQYITTTNTSNTTRTRTYWICEPVWHCPVDDNDTGGGNCAPVPEPTTSALLLVGLSSLFCFRKTGRKL